jgi:hypothetical protein
MTASTDNRPDKIEPRGLFGSLVSRLASTVLTNLLRIVRFLSRVVANGSSPNF